MWTVRFPSSSSLIVRGRPMNEASMCLPSIQTDGPHPLAGTMAGSVHGRCIAGALIKTWDTHGSPTQAGQDRAGGTRPGA